MNNDARLVAIPRSNPLPVSINQQFILNFHQHYPKIPSYYWHLPLYITLTGALDIPVLEQCLNELIRRQESLRTGFVTGEGRPWAHLVDTLSYTLPVIEVTGPVDVKQQLQYLARQPFDLAEPPLGRTVLLRLAADQHILLIIIHHLISDAWSQAIFLRELGKLYEAFSQGRPSPLPELSFQYLDYAAWEERRLRSGALIPKIDYWYQQLQPLPGLTKLPVDHRRPLVRAFEGEIETLNLPGALLDRLTEFSRCQGVTLFTTLLAAFALLLYQHTGEAEVMIGVPVANRSRSAFKRVLGCFATLLPLRLQLSAGQTGQELLRQTYQVSREALANQDAPMTSVIQRLKVRFHPGHWPLYQVVFAFQNAMLHRTTLPGLVLEADPLIWQTLGLARNDLVCQLYEVEAGLAGSVEYRTDLFEPATIQNLISDYHELLAHFITHPERPLALLTRLRG